MSPHVKFIYTKILYFGEDKRTQKVTKNTGKYTLQRADIKNNIKFSRLTLQKNNRAFVRFFLAGVTEINDAHFLPGTLDRSIT